MILTTTPLPPVAAEGIFEAKTAFFVGLEMRRTRSAFQGFTKTGFAKNPGAENGMKAQKKRLR